MTCFVLNILNRGYYVSGGVAGEPLQACDWISNRAMRFDSWDAADAMRSWLGFEQSGFHATFVWPEDRDLAGRIGPTRD